MSLFCIYRLFNKSPFINKSNCLNEGWLTNNEADFFDTADK